MGATAARKGLLVILTLGLFIRLVFLYGTKDTELKISDEQQYHGLALNLVQSNGFAWGPGQLTSFRPPLYSFCIAALWTITGSQSLGVIRAAQVGLSLLTVLLVYQLGLRLFNRRVALIAAGIFCFYPSLIWYDYFILSEIVFTLLLTAFALGYVVCVQTGKALAAWGTGCALGLAALTRSVLWLFPVVLLPLAWFSLSGSPWWRLSLVGLLLAGYLLVVGPWAVRNTLLQGTFTAVNTLGGFTFLMGNYEHTLIDRPWDEVTLQGPTSIFAKLQREYPHYAGLTEGQKEHLAQQAAVQFMSQHPGLTLRRSLVKFANFWGLEREILASWQKFYAPPTWLMVLGLVVIPSSYVFVMLLATLGIFLAPPAERSLHLFLLCVVLFITGLHTITFGHSRYHVPLISLLVLYAAAAIAGRSWRRLGQGWGTACAPIVLCLVWIAAWGREIAVVDRERIWQLLAWLLHL